MSESTRKTILLVEDEAIIAMTEKAALEKYGYAVITVTSGERAVEAVRTLPSIDLVLMDINLGSGIDGTEAAGIILKDHDIPIVFVSSHSEREIVERTEKITSYGYVVKNSSITVLDASIKMAFKLFDEKERFKAVNDKLEATFEALPDLIFEIGLDGYYYNSHSTHFDLFYKPLDELVGKKIPDILPSNISETIMSAVAEAHEKGISQGKQYEMHVPAGIRSFEISVSRIASFPDRPHFILLCRDITERKRVEEALRQSKDTAEMLLNVAAEIIISEDFEGNILLLNESGHAMLGYESPKLIGKNFFTTCLPEEARAEVGAYFKSLRDGAAQTSATHVNEVLTKSGARKTIYWHNAVIKDSNGVPIGLFSSGEDITGRMTMEAELAASEGRFKSILQDHPALAVQGYGADGVISYWNKAAERLYGYTAEEAVGRNLLDLIIPEGMRKYAAEAIKTMAETGEMLPASEFSLVKKDGQTIDVFSTHAVVKPKNRDPELFCFDIDISERKAMERALRKSEQEYRLITEHSADVIWVLSLKTGRFKFISPSIFQLRGLTPEEAMAEKLEDSLTPESMAVVRETMASDYQYFIEHSDSPRSSRKEVQQYCKNGEVIWVEVSTIYYCNAEGDIEIVGTSRNIEERKKAEQELMKSESRVKSLLAEKELVLKEVH